METHGRWGARGARRDDPRRGHRTHGPEDGWMKSWRSILFWSVGPPSARLAHPCKDGGPGLLFFDQQGQVRAGLTLLADGRPSLGLLDAQGHSRVVLSVESDGTPILRVAGCPGASDVVGTLRTGGVPRW